MFVSTMNAIIVYCFKYLLTKPDLARSQSGFPDLYFFLNSMIKQKYKILLENIRRKNTHRNMYKSMSFTNDTYKEMFEQR